MELTKEKFIEAYASTEEKPTKEEIDYIFSLLPLFTEDANSSIKHKYCSVDCDCNYSDEDEIVELTFKSPFSVKTNNEDSSNQRLLWVLACHYCGRWSLCD